MKTVNLCYAACWFLLSVLAVPALAEPAEDQLTAPEVSSSVPWVGAGLALAFAVAVAAAAFKNANRRPAD